jgi:hypothetical protein
MTSLIDACQRQISRARLLKQDLSVRNNIVHFLSSPGISSSRANATQITQYCNSHNLQIMEVLYQNPLKVTFLQQFLLRSVVVVIFIHHPDMLVSVRPFGWLPSLTNPF